MKKIFDIKKMGAIALGLVAFAPAASAQDEVETTIAADVANMILKEIKTMVRLIAEGMY